MLKQKDIAIVIQNPAQYYCIEPLLAHLKTKRYLFDIFVHGAKGDRTGFSDIRNSVMKLLKDKGYSVSAPSKKDSYKICLSPYCDMLDVNYEYLISYHYAPLVSKPNPTLKPDFQKRFHAILCASRYEQDVFGVYAKTYFVPDLKFIGFNKGARSSKQITVSYLPTYGDISSIESAKEAISALRLAGYRIIIKAHHGTSHLASEAHKKDIIREIADEYYEANTPIAKLLATSDVVISDNSGAVFDSMYAGIPVVIFSKDTNQSRLDRIETIQHRLVREGTISQAKSTPELLRAVKLALSRRYIERQLAFRDAMFNVASGTSAIAEWMAVLNDYLKDNVSRDYVLLHDYYLGEQKATKELAQQRLDEAQRKIDELATENSNLRNEIALFNSGKLYRASSKIYRIAGKTTPGCHKKA